MNKGLGIWGLGRGWWRAGFGLLTALAVLAAPTVAQEKDPLSGPVATFSILGYDPATGEVGGAVQSRVFTLTGVLTADADAEPPGKRQRL